MKVLSLVSLSVLAFAASCNEGSRQSSDVEPKPTSPTEIASTASVNNSNPLFVRFLKSKHYSLFKSSRSNARSSVRSLDAEHAKLYSLTNSPVRVLVIPVVNEGSQPNKELIDGPETQKRNPDDELEQIHGYPMQTETFNNVEEVLYYHNDETGESMAFIKSINGKRRYWPDGYDE